MADADPVILTITTGIVSGGANQRDYSYVGSFPGVMNQGGLPRYKGGAPNKRAVSYANGVTAPWARLPIKFRV